MATDYTFSISLLQAGYNSNELEVWQSGTLTLDSAVNSGELSLPGFYKEPIPFEGSTVPPQTQAGTIVVAQGQSSEVQMELTFVYNYDGFLYNGSYLGGTVSMLDYAAQETYLYVIQGISPQGPYGATFRGTPGAPDKRQARSS